MSKQRAKFRGHAQGKGYQNFDPGYAGLSRQQERDSKEISDLKENLQDIKARDSKQETEIERANTITAKSRDEAYSFVEDSTYQIRQDSLEKNKRQEEQNFQADQAKRSQETKNLMSLLDFSETLYKSVMTVKDKNWDATAEDSYNYYINNGGLPIERLQATDIREDAGFQQGQEINRQADELQKNGVDPRTVNWVRHKNSAVDYGFWKARAVNAGNQYGDWISEEIVKSGLSDPYEIRAKLDELQIEYLKQTGLYNPEKKMAMSADFLGPTLNAMAKSRNAVVSKYEGLDLQKKSQKLTEKSAHEFYTHQTVESLNNLFDTFSRELNEKGKPRGRNPELFLKTYLGDSSLISDEKYEELMSGLTSDGMIWGDRHKVHVDAIGEERTDDSAQDYRREKNKLTIGNAKLVDDTVEHFLTKDDFSDEELDQAISQLNLSGADTSKLQALQDHSIEERRNKFWEDHFEDLEKKGILRTSDVMRADVPRDVRKTFLPIAKQFDDYRKTTGTSDEDLKKTFNAALRERIAAGSLTSTAHYSLGLAEGRAVQLYNEKLVHYSKNSDPKAHENALNFVLEQIQQNKGDFHVTEVDLIDSLFGDKAFFSRFTPGDHEFAPQVANPLDFDKTLEQLQTNPDLINKKPLFDIEVLQQQAENIRRGQPITIPPLLYELSNANPERYGSALDMLQGQFKAAKIDVDVGKDFRVEWAGKTTDPATKKFLQKIQTKQEAILGYKILTGGTRDMNFMDPKIRSWMAGTTKDGEAQPGTAEYNLNLMIEASGDVLNVETVSYKDGVITANTAESLAFLNDNYMDYGLDRYYGHDHNGFGGFYYEYAGDEPI
tara:strand:+ start:4242 stop:6746 length:2505 start_codon:yes stop_codon:yes gene_type:complete